MIQWGAFAFGAVIGWFTYFVNRHRSEVRLTDVASILGALGGGVALTLFPEQTELFAWYGLGLAAGFFGYFLILIGLVLSQKGWTMAWFLDGRRPKLTDGQMIGSGGSRAMSDSEITPPWQS